MNFLDNTMLRSLKIKTVFFIFAINHYLINGQGTCVTGNNGYVTLEPGQLNILISAPHGGNLTPEYMLDYYNTSSNGIYTKEVAILVRDELSQYFSDCEKINARPFLIYNDLHRFLQILF